MKQRALHKYRKKHPNVRLVNMTRPCYPYQQFPSPDFDEELFSTAAREPIVVITIDGGDEFPDISEAYYMRYYPGASVGEVLAATNLIGFNNAGRIVSVSGVPVEDDVAMEVSLNGRVLATNAMDIELTPGDTIGIELY